MLPPVPRSLEELKQYINTFSVCALLGSGLRECRHAANTNPRETWKKTMEITLARYRLCSSRSVRHLDIQCSELRRRSASLLRSPPRFDDRNNVVVGSMKDPDMRLANSLGCGQVALG